MRAGPLNRTVRFERPVSDDALDGAGSGAWQPVAQVRANLQDMLPSRGDKIADGITVTARPARLRVRYRADLSPAMRVVLMRWDADTAAWVPGDRVMQIDAGPAELGRRDGLEFMVTDYRPVGNSA